MRSTHTFATLEISDAAYQEIKQKLIAADYHHALLDSREDGIVLAMHGIGLTCKQVDAVSEPLIKEEKFIYINAIKYKTFKDELTYEDIVGYVSLIPTTVFSVTYHTSNLGDEGILRRGQKIKISNGMYFDAVITNNA